MAAISEPFASGDSLLHRTDPRVRLAGAAALTLPMALAQSSEAAWFGLAVGFLLSALAQLDIWTAFKRLAAVNVFIIFLWVFLPFSMPGDTIWSGFGLTATRQGLDFALLLTLKANGITLCLMALIATIPVQDLGPAMQDLHLPAKLCHLLLFTHRYIGLIQREYQSMTRAASARGFKPGTNTRTYKTYAWIAGMLLVQSWDRAERVYAAMLCRGFNNRFLTLRTFRFGGRDIFMLALLIALAFSVSIIEFSINPFWSW